MREVGKRSRAQLEVGAGQARSDAGDVTVDRRLRAAETKRCEGGGGVAADTGELGELLGRRRPATTIVECLSRRVQESCPSVVAEPREGGYDIVCRGVREHLQRGEAGQEALENRHDAVDLCLLQHDLGDQGAIWVAGKRAAPWQRALSAREPLDHSRSSVGQHGRSVAR